MFYSNKLLWTREEVSAHHQQWGLQVQAHLPSDLLFLFLSISLSLLLSLSLSLPLSLSAALSLSNTLSLSQALPLEHRFTG